MLGLKARANTSWDEPFPKSTRVYYHCKALFWSMVVKIRPEKLCWALMSASPSVERLEWNSCIHCGPFWLIVWCQSRLYKLSVKRISVYFWQLEIQIAKDRTKIKQQHNTHTQWHLQGNDGGGAELHHLRTIEMPPGHSIRNPRGNPLAPIKLAHMESIENVLFLCSSILNFCSLFLWAVRCFPGLSKHVSQVSVRQRESAL